MATVATRPRARRRAQTAQARSICDTSQPPKISPFQLASLGMAMVWMETSPWGPSVLLSVVRTSVMQTSRQKKRSLPDERGQPHEDEQHGADAVGQGFPAGVADALAQPQHRRVGGDHAKSGAGQH